MIRPTIAVSQARSGLAVAHASGFNMANCDGSVHLIGYDIDPEVHLRAGHRDDQGLPLASIN